MIPVQGLAAFGGKTVADFDREAAEFEARKLQRQIEQQKLLAETNLYNANATKAQKPDFDALEVSGIAKLSGGLQPTPEELAAMKTNDAIRQTKLTIDPTTGLPMPAARSVFDIIGKPQQPSSPILPSTRPPPAVTQQIEPINASDLLPPQVTRLPTKSMPAPQTQEPVGIQIDGVAPMPTAMPTYRGVSLPEPANPKQQFETFKTETELAKEKEKMAFQQYLDSMKTAEGAAKSRATVKQILDRMDALNEVLKQNGGVITGDESPIARAGKVVSGTALGRPATAVSSPEVEAARQEYRNLQSTLLPFYAAAANLGARSLDSEGERKSILNSFGNPDGGNYNANKNQIANLKGTFGITPTDRATAESIDFQARKIATPEEIAEYKRMKGL